MSQHDKLPPKILIVGGGAAGLELATRLGRRLGRKGAAHITLVNDSPTHIWKPLLHEVAAGTLDASHDALPYLNQARLNHFDFRLGRMEKLDHQAKTISLAPTFNKRQQQVIPARLFHYDYLIIAVGSISYDFAIPGVSEHCLFLDNTHQAENFHRQLLETYFKIQTQPQHAPTTAINIAIVGAGATGVELSAQLHEVSHLLSTYGLDAIDTKAIKITIIEAADRVLPHLPEKLSLATHNELEKLDVTVLTGERVVKITQDKIYTASGKTVTADIKVWAAGIQAPPFLSNLGLATNNIHQLLVNSQLQSISDEHIYAIGDCAACRWDERDDNIPARAQAAHQMANYVYKRLCSHLSHQPQTLTPFRYHDHGSLVSLGKYSTVGNMMGQLSKGSLMIEGTIARIMYLSLYKMHQIALFGVIKTGLLTLAHLFRRTVFSKIKLH